MISLLLILELTRAKTKTKSKMETKKGVQKIDTKKLLFLVKALINSLLIELMGRRFYYKL